MTIAVAALPRLATEVLALPDDEIRAVVVDPTRDGKRSSAPFVLRSVSVLVDATAAARAEGVRPGMRVLDAQRYAPSLIVDVVKADRLAAELLVVAEVLLACAPVVEPILDLCSGIPLPCVALDVTHMVRPIARILVDVRRACARLQHRAAVVSSPGTRLSLAVARAVMSSSLDKTITVAGGKGAGVPRTIKIDDDDVDRTLAALPVSALELSSELIGELRALGVKTAAELARLLPKGGVERLGGAAKPVLDTLAARHVPLSGITAPEKIVEAIDLEHPILTLEPLSFVLNNLCQRLCIRVKARRQKVAELSLSLSARKRAPHVVTIAFPDSIADALAILRTLTTRLERVTLAEPIDKIALEVTRLAKKGPRQLSLPHVAGQGPAQVKAEEALSSLLAEMAAELGGDRVGCLVVTDEPLPEKMTRLQWPAPPAPERPPAPLRRRARRLPPDVKPLPKDALTSGGRFLAGWPWPLRLLPRPVRLAREASTSSDSRIVSRELLGVLEGEDRVDVPYARVYTVAVLADGRRALTLYDEEVEEEWVCGWFD